MAVYMKEILTYITYKMTYLRDYAFTSVYIILENLVLIYRLTSIRYDGVKHDKVAPSGTAEPRGLGGL